jgi:hypothetical protein
MDMMMISIILVVEKGVGFLIEFAGTVNVGNL